MRSSGVSRRTSSEGASSVERTYGALAVPAASGDGAGAVVDPVAGADSGAEEAGRGAGAGRRGEGKKKFQRRRTARQRTIARRKRGLSTGGRGPYRPARSRLARNSGRTPVARIR